MDEDVDIRIGQLEAKVENIAETLKALNHKVSQVGKTDWGLLASWAAVLLTLIGGYSYMNMEPIKTEIEKLRGWKNHTIDQVLSLSTENEICRERIRTLERQVFQEPKDM